MTFGTPLAFNLQGSGPVNNNPSLYSADAMAIDIKADDGLPAQGKVQGLNWDSAMTQWNLTVTTCFRTPDYSDLPAYRYNLDYTRQDACALVFRNVF